MNIVNIVKKQYYLDNNKTKIDKIKFDINITLNKNAVFSYCFTFEDNENSNYEYITMNEADYNQWNDDNYAKNWLLNKLSLTAL